MITFELIITKNSVAVGMSINAPKYGTGFTSVSDPINFGPDPDPRF